MTPRVIPVGHLDEDQVRSVLRAAMAAPSPRDSPVWEFHCTATTIELHADSHREQVLSCGAALLNLRLAIRALGVRPAVSLLPDPHRPDLLAIVQPQGHIVVRPVDWELADAIFRRGPDHGPFHHTAVPLPVVTGLRQAAKAERAWLPTLTAAQLPILRDLVDQAQDGQRRDPAPVPVPDPLVAVVGTFHDSPLARLQAGQATQRVLLTATVAGLSASFLSQVVSVPATRQQLRGLVIGGLWPQVVLQLGYRTRLPVTPRRDLDDEVTSGPRVG
jgi:hypothetical protein